MRDSDLNVAFMKINCRKSIKLHDMMKKRIKETLRHNFASNQSKKTCNTRKTWFAIERFVSTTKVNKNWSNFGVFSAKSSNALRISII